MRHMNTQQTSAPRRFWVAAAGGVAFLGAVAHAAPFLYSPGDLVLSFRQPGNAFDYVVNLGKATAFTSVAAGTSGPVTNLSATQLNAAFPSINGLNWSVVGANRPPGDPAFPLQTLWASSPRLDASIQSAPWLRKGSFLQGTAGSFFDVVGANAAAYSSSQAAGANNTVAGVLIPAGSDYAFSPIVGDAGDFGAFQGSVENRTADDFDGAPENVSRSDLYEILPGTSADGTLGAASRYLGYFELKADGGLTFNTGKPSPTRPTITRVSRKGEVTTVSFTSTSGATHRLRSTDAAGLTSPISSWTVGASVRGDGAVLSLDDTGSASIRFYAVEVQP